MKESQGKTVYLKDYQAPDFLIDRTELDFDLHEEFTTVTSVLHMRRNPAGSKAKAPLVLNGEKLELLWVKVDGQAVAEENRNIDEHSLTVNEVPDTFIFSCQTRIKPQENTTLEGLYKSRVMFCTQCEAEGFRKITYYLDRPDVLSSFTTTITGDRARYPVMLSNGNKIGEGVVEGDDTRHRVTWEDPFKKPSYLFALVAGDLESVQDSFTTMSNRQVKLEIFVEKKDLDKCEFALASLKRAMKWDEEVYGREYDLDIFMIVAVDDFNMGAMENKGLNIFNSSCVLANPATTTDFSFQNIEAIVAHEYFHNWSGNRVTCRDWFQLSLKEGFTVFRDSEFTADMHSRAVKRIEDVNFLRTVQFAEDAGPMSHSVRPESYMEISNFYTVTIYEKGAEVVRMQAEFLGPELFRKGTDLYFDRFDGQAVTTEDFISCMEEVSGQDLTRFRRWYTQAGTPVLKVKGEYDAASGSYTLHVEQSCPPTPRQAEKLPFHIPLSVALLGSKGNELPLHLQGEEKDDEKGKEKGKEISTETSKVLHVKEAVQDFTFTGLKEKPVPSLLRSFSAPVKLHMEYSRDDLRFLMSHDSDGFARWEAGFKLALQLIEEGLQKLNSGKTLSIDARLVEGMRAVLRTALDDHAADRAMLSNLLYLPSESYIGEQYESIDVPGIYQVREFLRKRLAIELEAEFAAVYALCNTGEVYVFSGEAMGTRALKNASLGYLMLLNKPDYNQACLDQFESADNMTDAGAALRTLINNPSPEVTPGADKAVNDFYDKWKHEALVVEQWFSMQAGANLPDNLTKVKALLEHEAFDIKNPNKVRSVIGAFCVNNLVGFHQEDGSGYAFLADKVLELNKLNPQIASRQLTPLTRWRKQPAARQALMKAQLERIMSSEGLSSDVHEIVSKSLQA